MNSTVKIPMKSLFCVLLGCLGWALAQASPTALNDGPAQPRVKIGNGLLAGTTAASGVRMFRGIPYAQPPVGRLRWAEPLPAKNWSDVRPADHFGDRPMQPTLWKDMIFRSEHMSEDCLYLNVWAPAVGRDLPVLVYFHGGGLIAGDGSEPRYDGEAFARRGIVVVTVNYRLGVFGYLAHPALTKESRHHASGNYGYLDQNAALRWVQANIEAFGGDPAKVTIGGQSAGASSVSAHMASPLSRGLFRGAIAESGSLLSHEPVKPRSEGERFGVEFAAELGAKSVADLRKLPAEKLLAAGGGTERPWPKSIIDGYFLTEQPLEVFFTGRQAEVPLLAGWTTAEVDYHSLLQDEAPTPENFVRKLRELYGADADEALRLYPAATAAEARRSATDLATDRFEAYRTWKLIDESWKSGGQPVFRYLWAHVPPSREGGASASAQPMGAAHSSELPYLFGSLKIIPDSAWTAADYQASDMLHGYVANFVATGNPNGEGLPQWPWFQASIPKVMVLDSNPHTTADTHLRRYQFLDTH